MERLKKMHRLAVRGVFMEQIVFAPETGGMPSLKLTASLHLKMKPGRKEVGSYWKAMDFLGANWLLVLRSVFPRGLKNPPELINSQVATEKLGGGNSNIFLFSPRNLGKISNLTHIVQMGWFNHQPESYFF